MLLFPSEKGPTLAATRPKKSQGKSRRTLQRQPDSLDSVDSCSTVSSLSSSCPQPSAPSRRFRLQSKLPSSSQDLAEQDSDVRPRFSSRGTFNPEKSKQKLHSAKYSSQRPPEDQGHNRDPDIQAQQLVLYGTNEFMVWSSCSSSLINSFPGYVVAASRTVPECHGPKEAEEAHWRNSSGKNGLIPDWFFFLFLSDRLEMNTVRRRTGKDNVMEEGG